MMHRGSVLTLLMFIAGHVADEPKRPSADEQRVRTIAAEIIAADNARAIERVLALYADDAVLLPPNDAAVRGKAAIRPRYEQLFRSNQPELIGKVDEVRVTGDWAYIIGTNTGRFVPLAGGTARSVSDAYVMILQLGADKTWRIARLIWHPNVPAK